MPSERPSLTDAQIDAILRATGERLDVPPTSDAAARARAHIELRASWGQKGHGRGVVIPFPAEPADVDATTGAQGGHLSEERGSRLRELALLAAGLAAAAVLAVVLTLVFRGFDGGSDGDRSDVAGGPLAAEPYEIPGYEFVRAIGRPQVPNEPVDVAIGPDGTLFVLDSADDRVIAFTPDGEIETDWGDGGFSTQIPGAHALGAGPYGDVYVAADHVYVIDESGQQTDTLIFPPPPEDAPSPGLSQGLVVDTAGNVFVAGMSEIWRFEASTGVVSTIEVAAGRGFQLAIDSRDQLYIATLTGSVLSVNPDGTTEEFGRVRSSQAIAINGFALAPDGSVVLFQSSSGGNESSMFIRLDSQGDEIARWPVDRSGFFIGTLGPLWFGIDVTADGTILLPDPLAHRLAMFDADGTLTSEVRDDSPDAFGRLWHLALDGDGNVLGYDPSLHGKVLKFSPGGELLQTVAIEDTLLGAMVSLLDAGGFAATEDGGFVIAGQMTNQVTVYSPDGALEQEWGQLDPLGEAGLAFPMAVTLDEEGFIYLVDQSDGDNLRKFTLDGEFISEIGSVTSDRVDLAYHDSAIWGIDDGTIVRFPVDGGDPHTVAIPNGVAPAGVLPGHALALALDDIGNIYTYTMVFRSEPASVTGTLVKLDPQGNLIWTVELAQDAASRYVDLAIAPDGTLYLADSELRQILAYRPTAGEQDVATSEPTATAEPDAAYVPAGEVPDMLVVERVGEADGPPQFGIYDPASEDLIELPQGELVGISPDGGVLLLIDRGPGDEWVRLELIAALAETFEELWRTDIGELNQNKSNTIYFDTAIAGDIVYVAIHDPDYRGEMLEIAQVRLSDGFMRRYGSSGMDTDIGNLTDPTVEVSLLASLPSEAPAITSFIRAPDEGRTTIQSVASAGYDYRLRELVAVQRGERYLLPVGDGLVNIPHSGYTTDPAVEYVMFEDVSAGRIDLPFDSTEGGDGTIVEYALSHDGRRLYALSPYDGQIAVIDLERLEIVTFASLEDETPPASQVEGLDREELPPFYAQHPMALSPDGRYLYALGTLYPLTGGYTPGIWKIDTSTWTIVDESAPGGSWSTLSIHSNRDGSELYVSLGLRGPSSDGEYVLESPGMLAVDTATLDDRTGLIDLGGYVVVGTLADVYRDFHGRSPTVDGVAPG